MTSHELDNAAAWRSHGFDGDPDDLLSEQTLVHGWRHRWQEAPDHPTLFDSTFGWIDGRELELRTADVAGRFVAEGVKSGDRVLMSCQPSIELVITHIGALRAGCTVVPVNTAYTSAELGNIARESGGFYLPLHGAKTMDMLYAQGLAPLPKADADAGVETLEALAYRSQYGGHSDELLLTLGKALEAGSHKRG